MVNFVAVHPCEFADPDTPHTFLAPASLPCGATHATELNYLDRWSRRIPHRTTQLATLLDMLMQLREDAGLSQASLAHRLGITQSEVSKYERGERALDVLRLRDWLRVLEVEFTTFADALDQELKRHDVFVA